MGCTPEKYLLWSLGVEDYLVYAYRKKPEKRKGRATKRKSSERRMLISPLAYGLQPFFS